MKDSFGREITTLRISVTDRCNLKCYYCMPGGVGEFAPPSEVISLDEILRVVRATTSLGVRNYRITGGEPLVREGLVDFIGRLRETDGVERISLTTNGLLLEGKVDALLQAGVDGLNLSLDTLDREKFARITGADVLERVRRGIERAMDAPFRAVKLNVVAMRGVNDDEILDFLELCRDGAVHLRFIEYMPRGDFSEEASKKIPCEEILDRIREVHAFEKDPGPQGTGPATYYRVPGWAGTFGVISPVTNPFCELCNRIRLTCRGEIKSCLLIEEFLDLRPILRNGAGTEALLDVIGKAIREKPERHDFRRHFPMNSIGG